jgi:mevalonate pyrophosphate decarboxylase
MVYGHVPDENGNFPTVQDNNYASDDQMVSHPSHYLSDKGIEVIDVIEAFTDGLNGIEATDTGNVIKYICRWKQKNGIQDLEKAMWYLTHLINHIKECK